jgi:transcriptional regulator with XRE-family HTH domain
MTHSPADSAAARPFAHLANHLIALRRAARLPQRALAEVASVSRGAIQRAESGTAAPSPTVLDAYVRACGASPTDQARARLLRTRGRADRRDKLRFLNAPAPALIHTKDDLAAALAAAYERAGAPSLSDGRLTPGRKPLPRTTAWRIVQRKGLPATAEQLVTFLTACGVRPAEQHLYLDAYQRITAGRAARLVPPRGPRVLRPRGRTGDKIEITGRAANLARLIPVSAIEEALVAGVHQWASREAHLNGATPPDLLPASSFLGHGVDPARLNATVFTTHTTEDDIGLIARTADGRTTLYQIKSHGQHPGAAPTLRVPMPPDHPGRSSSRTVTTNPRSPDKPVVPARRSASIERPQRRLPLVTGPAR